MRVVRDYPPNIDEIAASLPEARSGVVLFCYGDTIYNPAGIRIPFSLRAHEAAHSKRQGHTEAEIREWWRKYAADEMFRLDEELPAHRAEYAAFCEQTRDKEHRFRFLVTLAKRLSGPLYGGLIEFGAAKRAIREAAT